MSENSKEVAEIIAGLNATETNVILEAIKQNRKYGNAVSFRAMLALLKQTDEPTIETAIIEFLFDLKDENGGPILIEAIENSEFEFYTSFLVAAFWQSAIDGSPYIENLIRAAIQGDYMTTLEALTVIENFDSAFNQMDILDYETDLNEAAESEENGDKKALLISMADVIRNLPIEGE